MRHATHEYLLMDRKYRIEPTNYPITVYKPKGSATFVAGKYYTHTRKTNYPMAVFMTPNEDGLFGYNADFFHAYPNILMLYSGTKFVPLDRHGWETNSSDYLLVFLTTEGKVLIERDQLSLLKEVKR